LGASDTADAEWRYAALRERGAPKIELRKAEVDRVVDLRYRSG
jgi:hypothetical protein